MKEYFSLRRGAPKRNAPKAATRTKGRTNRTEPVEPEKGIVFSF